MTNNSSRYEQQQAAIRAAIASFPSTFGLRGFPNSTFRINERDSFFSDSTMYLYVHILNADGQYRSFAKGTVSELRREITSTPADSKPINS